MGNESDSAIYAALLQPTVIGPHGELFVLSEDGKIINVDVEKDRGQYCFLFIHQGVSDISLVVRQDQINVLLRNNAPCNVNNLDDFFVCTKLIPIYPQAFIINHNNGESTLFCNAKKGLRLFQILSTNVKEVNAPIPMKAFAGWVSGEYIYIAGMIPRNRSEDKRGFTLQRGEACIAKLDIHEGKYLIHTPEIKLSEWMKKDLYHYIGSTGIKYINPKIECWLSSFVIENKQILIGAIIDQTPSDSDWYIQEAISWSDYFITGFFCLDGDVLEPLGLIYPYAFVQSLQFKNDVLLYFVDHSGDNGLKIRDISFMVATNKLITGIEPKALTFSNIDVDETLGYFNVRYDESVGFYGILSTLGKHASMISYLIMSDDGKDWRAVEKLKNVKK